MNYNEMLLMFNEIFRQPPAFGSVGPPMYMIMARVMNTQGGFSAFTKQSLNYHFKKMMKTWELYLLSPESTSTLNSEEGGWFSDQAVGAMMEYYDSERTFQDVFICDKSLPAWGFTSYEDFFIRRYRDATIDRPTGDIQDLRLISAACESALYAIKTDVQRSDELFIKDEAYSLVHLLAGDTSVDSFVGGIVIQSFLNTTGYHRWHAPVNGTVLKIVDVPGTYFAQAPSTLGDETPEGELPPYLRSLTYFANTAARQLIFINADNEKIGLMCFIAIGMTEISTCQATVYEGQHVVRGQELGMFHFGGSSSALVFRKEANVQVGDEFTQPGAHLPINAIIAVADV
jgi:phosphatidylserine decarboxylase